MSHSYRKTPIFGNVPASSEKLDKRHAHHRERGRVRAVLAHIEDLEAVQLPAAAHAYSEVHDFAKDGKSYVPIRVRRTGRTLSPLHVPSTLRDSRSLHKKMGK